MALKSLSRIKRLFNLKHYSTRSGARASCSQKKNLTEDPAIEEYLNELKAHKPGRSIKSGARGELCSSKIKVRKDRSVKELLSAEGVVMERHTLSVTTDHRDRIKSQRTLHQKFLYQDINNIAKVIYKQIRDGTGDLISKLEAVTALSFNSQENTVQFINETILSNALGKSTSSCSGNTECKLDEAGQIKDVDATCRRTHIRKVFPNEKSVQIRLHYDEKGRLNKRVRSQVDLSKNGERKRTCNVRERIFFDSKGMVKARVKIRINRGSTGKIKRKELLIEQLELNQAGRPQTRRTTIRTFNFYGEKLEELKKELHFVHNQDSALKRLDSVIIRKVVKDRSESKECYSIIVKKTSELFGRNEIAENEKGAPNLKVEKSSEDRGQKVSSAKGHFFSKRKFGADLRAESEVEFNLLLRHALNIVK